MGSVGCRAVFPLLFSSPLSLLLGKPLVTTAHRRGRPFPFSPFFFLPPHWYGVAAFPPAITGKSSFFFFLPLLIHMPGRACLDSLHRKEKRGGLLLFLFFFLLFFPYVRCLHVRDPTSVCSTDRRRIVTGLFFLFFFPFFFPPLLCFYLLPTRIEMIDRGSGVLFPFFPPRFPFFFFNGYQLPVMMKWGQHLFSFFFFSLLPLRPAVQHPDRTEKAWVAEKFISRSFSSLFSLLLLFLSILPLVPPVTIDHQLDTRWSNC